MIQREEARSAIAEKLQHSRGAKLDHERSNNLAWKTEERRQLRDRKRPIRSSTQSYYRIEFLERIDPTCEDRTYVS